MSEIKNMNSTLSDKDLENISGGATAKVQTMKIACVHCGRPFNADVSKSFAICPNPTCKKINYFSG